MDAKRKTFTAPDGTTISYLTEGSGPPLLLLHGFVSSATSWWKIGAAQRLRRNPHDPRPRHPRPWGQRQAHRICLLRPHAAFRPPPPPRLRGHADADVIGFSMGAELALALAAFHPARVRSLTLSGSGWSPPEIVDEYRKWFDVARREIGLPRRAEGPDRSVPRSPACRAETIAALPMPLTGIIGALDDERPYMERITEVARTSARDPAWPRPPRHVAQRGVSRIAGEGGGGRTVEHVTWKKPVSASHGAVSNTFRRSADTGTLLRP
jgi:pimeloyl-ACP methyl ester carboxylesterase